MQEVMQEVTLGDQRAGKAWSIAIIRVRVSVLVSANSRHSVSFDTLAANLVMC